MLGSAGLIKNNKPHNHMQKRNLLTCSLGSVLVPMLAAVLMAGCESADKNPTTTVAPAAVAPAPAKAAPVEPAEATPPSAPAQPAEVAPLRSAIRIDAGSDTNFTDAAGNVWLSDRGFDGGDNSVREDNLEIANTKDPGLYRTEHWGMSSFSQPLPNGKYVVKLHFAETYEGIEGPGGRIFSFNVAGQDFKDFDVFVKAGGKQRAYVETVNVDIADGKLDISFESGVDNPEINAIEIIPAP